jgi:hypothetical protein
MQVFIMEEALSCSCGVGSGLRISGLLLLFCFQVNELDSAVTRAAEQPQRFGLTPEEIASRRKWISTTRRQVCWVAKLTVSAVAYWQYLD